MLRSTAPPAWGGALACLPAGRLAYEGQWLRFANPTDPASRSQPIALKPVRVYPQVSLGFVSYFCSAARTAPLNSRPARIRPRGPATRIKSVGDPPICIYNQEG